MPREDASKEENLWVLAWLERPLARNPSRATLDVQCYTVWRRSLYGVVLAAAKESLARHPNVLREFVANGGAISVPTARTINHTNDPLAGLRTALTTTMQQRCAPRDVTATIRKDEALYFVEELSPFALRVFHRRQRELLPAPPPTRAARGLTEHEQTMAEHHYTMTALRNDVKRYRQLVQDKIADAHNDEVDLKEQVQLLPRVLKTTLTVALDETPPLEPRQQAKMLVMANMMQRKGSSPASPMGRHLGAHLRHHSTSKTEMLKTLGHLHITNTPSSVKKHDRQQVSAAASAAKRQKVGTSYSFAEMSGDNCVWKKLQGFYNKRTAEQMVFSTSTRQLPADTPALLDPSVVRNSVKQDEVVAYFDAYNNFVFDLIPQQGA